MKTITLLVIATFFLPIIGIAQQFWNTTNEFWGGPKTGIVLVDDSIFFVGTTNSVLRSIDEFDHLEQVLSASEIHTVFATQNRKLLVGGTGKIFLSDNFGISWDSVTVNTTFPLKQFIENSYGELLAITGINDDGDGVFFSGDGGLTWDKRNNGLGTHLGCNKIAIDKNGRLYLAIQDEDVIGFGGLFISETTGLLWQKVAVNNIDLIGNSARVGIVTNLTVLPNDSIYLSFSGSGGNFAIEVNINKSINDVTDNSAWKIFYVKQNQTWGTDGMLNNIYIAQNDDWYSSITESISRGGTCYSKDGKNWALLDYGLGADLNNRRSEQFFAETSAGRIFMIQYLDERIYKTDKSIFTSSPKPIDVVPQINVYPNPVSKGEKLHIKLAGSSEENEVSVYDLTGRKIYSQLIFESKTEINAPLKQGMYIIEAKNLYSKSTKKILVE